MEKYNYREVMKADIREWLVNNDDDLDRDTSFDDLYDDIYDTLWAEDEITGNGSFWYDSEHNCEEYVCHNLDLLFEALSDFGELEAELVDHIKEHKENNTVARWADCVIRCYVLGECLYEVLKELGYDERPEKN